MQKAGGDPRLRLGLLRRLACYYYHIHIDESLLPLDNHPNQDYFNQCTRQRAQEAAEAWRLNADAQVSAI